MFFLQTIEKTDPAWSTKPELKSWVGALVALALLWRLDDAVIAEFIDGRGLSECVMDIAELRDRLQLPEHVLRAIDFASKDSSSKNATKAAKARHQKTEIAKKFIAEEWSLHRKAYQDNKSAFSRDYVRRVRNEHSVTITEKQMREVWLKDTPPASNQAG